MTWAKHIAMVLAVSLPASCLLAQQGPVRLTLDQALSRAQANEPSFAAASAASRVAALDHSIARAALLPNALYHNQYLYTQPNGGQNQAGSTGTQSAPRFIANNAVHEYASQGTVTESIGFQQLTAVSRAAATAAIASAELEIARRGLVATVVTLFYGSLAADHKLAVAQRTECEAATFTTLTEQREAARESAHADVVKAQLQQQQRERDLADARLQSQKSRLELAVLVFPDPRVDYSLTAPAVMAPLETLAELEIAASHGNPELRSVMASLRGSDLDVRAARAAYLPDLGMNFSYGIDAEQFATKGPEGVRNLGYSAAVTLDIPLWDWLNTQRKVKQAKILQGVAAITLSATQRRLIAQLEENYAEASEARTQIQSLELSVTTAAESLRLTRMRYIAGEATVLEVVDAQNSLATAELAHVDGTLRYETALANLQILTGSL